MEGCSPPSLAIACNNSQEEVVPSEDMKADKDYAASTKEGTSTQLPNDEVFLCTSQRNRMAFLPKPFSEDHSARDLFFVKETLEETLAHLFENSKTPSGRSSFALENIISYLLNFSGNLAENYSTASSNHLIMSIRTFRNLCVGESINLKKFLHLFGVESLRIIFQSVNYDPKIVQVGLQLLANVVLTDSSYHLEVWRQFYPFGFMEASKVHVREVSDLMCRILFELCKSDDMRLEELSTKYGHLIIAEVIQTFLLEDFAEDHFLWLLSKLCYVGTFFQRLYFKLSSSYTEELGGGNYDFASTHFTGTQVFLMSLLSKIHEKHVSDDFALSVFQILKYASLVVHSTSTNEMHSLAISHEVEILDYSLAILRDISASVDGDEKQESALDSLLCTGFTNFLLDSLRKLEPPKSIRKISGAQDLYEDSIPCPYKGYRGDLIVIIANCAFRRKDVQDEIRQKGGITLLLQQCVIDEENPLSKEKTLWAIRNLLEGNDDNQREVAELEVQGSVNLPEIDELGLRVEVDPVTRRAKLVNVPASASKSD